MQEVPVDPSDRPQRRPGGHLDALSAREQLEGRVVLVSGVGGALGAELCRQVARHHPARLILLDHDDQKLAMTQLSLAPRTSDAWDDLLLVDIRDLPALTALLLLAAPDVVIHTAALHDPELAERYPREAWQTNADGTRNMLEAATSAGVGTFVTVTRPVDGGADTALGRSQLEAERLTASFTEEHLARYVVVRLSQEVIRTLPLEECSRLVLDAAALGVDGQVVEAAAPPVGAVQMS